MTQTAGMDRSAIRARSKARRLAMQALYQWQLTGMAARDIAAQFAADDTEFGGADGAYFDELVGQVVTRLAELDAHLTPHLDRPLDEVDPVERAVLRMAVYELAHRPDVPYRVVINEAVDLTKKFGAEQGHSYVNGVLDRLARTLRPLEQGGGPRPGPRGRG